MSDPRYSVEGFVKEVADIARPYHFDVFFSDGCFAPAAEAPDQVTASIRTAALPGVNLAEVPVSYYGITYKLAGTPTYEPLNCQFIIDHEYKNLAQWQKIMDIVYRYDQGPNYEVPETYMGNMTLIQMDTKQNTKRTYKLQYAWLSAISAIQYGHETKDSPLTFDATISYTYHILGTGE
jgi:hypothetical protein